MNLQYLTNYFQQIELLEGVKQKSKPIVVDDNTENHKKTSSQHTKSVKAKTNAKGKLPSKDKKKSVSYTSHLGEILTIRLQ